MTSPAELLKDILVAADVGVFIADDLESGDWRIYIGMQPENPAEQITLNDSGGLPSSPKWLLDFPSISVIVRGNTYPRAYAKAKDVKDALLGYTPQNVLDDESNLIGRIDGIIMINDLAFIGVGNRELPMFSMTFRMFYEPATSDLSNREEL